MSGVCGKRRKTKEATELFPRRDHINQTGSERNKLCQCHALVRSTSYTTGCCDRHHDRNWRCLAHASLPPHPCLSGSALISAAHTPAPAAKPGAFSTATKACSVATSTSFSATSGALSPGIGFSTLWTTALQTVPFQRGLSQRTTAHQE